MNNCPDFFTSREPIETNITPLKFGKDIYWMSSAATVQEYVVPKTHLKPYEDNDDGLLDCMDLEDGYDIVLTKAGKFTTSFYVPLSLLRYIIGAKGSKLKELQRSTNTVIQIPRPGEKGDVKIIGDTERNVASARSQISLVVLKRKEKQQMTHFVSIPVFSDNVRDKFHQFREEILKNPARGVTNSLFQKPEKLHLTLSVVTLVDDEEIDIAKKTLQKCYDEVISNIFKKNQKYSIIVKGVEIMNDDPSEVGILYGKVSMKTEEETCNLQDMADKIVNYFHLAGLAQKEYDKVKLHVTLMNKKFRDEGEEFRTFDANTILQDYKNFYFGEVELNNIQLSIRGTSGNGKYYESALTIEI